MALEKYGSGKFKLSQLIAPAIELARNGYKSATIRRSAGGSSRARTAPMADDHANFFSNPTAR